MAGDRPRQPAYEIFSTKRRFYQSQVLTLSPQGGLHRWTSKMATPYKVVILLR